MTIDACEAGKHVLCEKPAMHNIAEGLAMVHAAREHKRVVAIGLQQRSGEHFKEAIEIVRSGRLGKITTVHCWNVGNETPNGIGNPPDGDPPPGLDWDFWLGPAPKRPYNPEPLYLQLPLVLGLRRRQGGGLGRTPDRYRAVGDGRA
jgi:hypothetical protein